MLKLKHTLKLSLLSLAILGGLSACNSDGDDGQDGVAVTTGVTGASGNTVPKTATLVQTSNWMTICKILVMKDKV